MATVSRVQNTPANTAQPSVRSGTAVEPDESSSNEDDDDDDDSLSESSVESSDEGTSDESPGAELSAEAKRAWDSYLNAVSDRNVPDLRRFAGCREVNLSYVDRLRGLHRGSLRSVMRAIQRLHVKRRSWKISCGTAVEMRGRVKFFFENATSIVSTQDELRAGLPAAAPTDNNSGQSGTNDNDDGCVEVGSSSSSRQLALAGAMRMTLPQKRRFQAQAELESKTRVDLDKERLKWTKLRMTLAQEQEKREQQNAKLSAMQKRLEMLQTALRTFQERGEQPPPRVHTAFTNLTLAIASMSD